MLRYIPFFLLVATFLIPQLHSHGGDANNAKLINDPKTGNTVAVWMEVDSSTGNAVIKSSILKSNKSLWSKSTTISNPSTSAMDHISLTINDIGNIVAVWQAYDLSIGAVTLSAATLPLGGSSNPWSPPVQISSENENVITVQDVFIDNKNNGIGVIYVTWTSYIDEEKNSSIRFDYGTFNDAGGSWTPPQRISS